MTHNNSDEDIYYSFKEISSFFRKYLVYLRKKIWFFLIFILIFFGGAVIFYFNQQSIYIGKSSFILQEKSTSIGGLSSIANQLGLDIAGATGGNSLFAGENIIDIIQSRNILEKSLLTKIDLNGSKVTLADLFMKSANMQSDWIKSPQLQNLSFNNYEITGNLDKFKDSVLQIISKKILKKHLKVERTDKKTTIIAIEVESKNMLLSKYLSERLIEEAATYYINVKTSLLRRNVNRLENRVDSLLRILNSKTFSSSNTRIIDINPSLPTLLIPNELANRDRIVLLNLYGEIVKNLEIARVTLNQETPVIQLLDKPGLTLFDGKVGLVKCIFIFLFIGLFIFFFVMLYFYKK